MKTRFVSATGFKAHCLALLDEVGKSGTSITVTKRGRPVATVGPAARQRWQSPKGTWAGKVKIADEILDRDTADLWDAVREAENHQGRR